MEKENIQKNEHQEHVLHFTLNGKRHTWHEQYITGASIRKVGSLDADDEIFLKIEKPWEDEKVNDDTKIDLARPEVEHFISKEKPFKVAIIVNLKEHTWIEKKINFEQVVTLAYGTYDPNPGKGYTVTYDRGPHQNPEGSMVKGNIVFVKDKMIFNVKQTDKS